MPCVARGGRSARLTSGSSSCAACASIACESSCGGAAARCMPVRTPPMRSRTSSTGRTAPCPTMTRGACRRLRRRQRTAVSSVGPRTHCRRRRCRRRHRGRIHAAGRLHRRRRPPRLCNQPRPPSPPRLSRACWRWPNGLPTSTTQRQEPAASSRLRSSVEASPPRA
eukprot:134754-Chlamydomonas_euryale.AAC.1